jgi:aryl sulfotransferase
MDQELDMNIAKVNDGPGKLREFQNFIMDSTRWNDFKFRDDDVVIVAWAKSGTTWLQQIVSQLIFNGAEGLEVWKLSPWYDFRANPPQVFAAAEAQTNRRFIKTHLPADALLMSPRAKYLYIGRDGRDAAWSLFNHFGNLREQILTEVNNVPCRVGRPMERGAPDVHAFYREWLLRDGYPAWPFWEHVRTWWSLRDQANVKLLHFNGLKADLEGSIRAIAEFLGIDTASLDLETIVEHCTFDYMKAHAELSAPRGGMNWDGGAATFINKGTNGRWSDVLSADEVAAYEARAVAELGPECAAWLAGRG